MTQRSRLERNDAAAVEPTDAAARELTLTRLDCGTATIKDFDKFFSDKPGLYEKGPRELSDSCYLIRHGDQHLLWDTAFPSALAGRTRRTWATAVARLTKTVARAACASSA